MAPDQPGKLPAASQPHAGETGPAAAVSSEDMKEPIQEKTFRDLLVEKAADEELQRHLQKSIKAVLASYKSLTDHFFLLGLMDSQTSIGDYELDRIFEALKAKDAKHANKDILLVLLSKGGSIEPAFQISKLCKQHAKKKFITAVPRYAKSAATLLAIGSDEIHMSALGQLGPIDPQIDGLPALGVVQALESVASIVEKHPDSAEMFARYLQRKLTVEQIGYCERIAESATQYAERLLGNKSALLPNSVSDVASDLVREYKDHGFVIDLEEARLHLGDAWLHTDTEALKLAEAIYDILEDANLLLRLFKKSRYAMIAGSLTQIRIFRIP